MRPAWKVTFPTRTTWAGDITSKSDIHEDTFKNLQLEFLDVSRNKFTSLTNGVLHSNLLYLDISYQCSLCEGIGDFTINPNKFHDNHMEKLKVLKMSGLRIHRVDNETFTGLTGVLRQRCGPSLYTLT